MIYFASFGIFWFIFSRIIGDFEVAAENSKVGIIIKEFPVSENAVLRCDSVDDKHNFDYWYRADSNDIIGPNNQGGFDYLKYGYEVLSGNLTIRNIDVQDIGIYTCVSRGVRSDSTKLTTIKVRVLGEVKESEEEINALKIILAICSLILFCCFIYAAYRVWKDRYMYPRYLEHFDDEDDIEETAEDIYRAPSTSGIIRQSIVKETPTKQPGVAEDYKRPLISTDFESILESRI